MKIPISLALLAIAVGAAALPMAYGRTNTSKHASSGSKGPENASNNSAAEQRCEADHSCDDREPGRADPHGRLDQPNRPAPIANPSRAASRSSGHARKAVARNSPIKLASARIVPALDNGHRQAALPIKSTPLKVDTTAFSLPTEGDVDHSKLMQVNFVNVLAIASKNKTTIPVELGNVSDVRLGQLMDDSFVTESINNDNPEACEAIASAGNKLQIIGVRTGTAQLKIQGTVAKHDEVNGTIREPTTIELSVQVSIPAAIKATSSKIEAISRAISVLHPYSEVRFALDRQQIVATGTCDSEMVAKKILSITRRTLLLPVVDRITIQQPGAPSPTPSSPQSTSILEPDHIQTEWMIEASRSLDLGMRNSD